MNTPTEFRNFYDEWKKTAPPNDSDIIPPKPRRSASPRHNDLSKELQGLLFWRHISKAVQPLSTNWMVPDNDNDAGKEDDEPRASVRSTECEHIIRPSEDEMMEAVENVEYETRIYNMKVPLPGPDVEYGKEYKACPPLKGAVRPIARIGSIRFATKDSDQNGRRQSPTRGSIVSWHATPNTHGYFLVDDFGAPLGSDENDEDIHNSNQFFADLLGAQPHRYTKGGFCRRGGLVESSQLPTLPPPSMALNEARAFCGLKPAVPSNDNRAALPSGSRKVADSFVGHKITSEAGDDTGGEPADEWIVRKQECIALRAKLSATDAKALDTAIHASNFKDIGKAFEFTEKTAERQGKRLLLAASKNLSALIANVAA
jgi:hypothetical protein